MAERTTTARQVYLRRGEAQVGLSVCVMVQREIRRGVITQIFEPRNRHMPRRCTVQLHNKTVERPEPELFQLINTEGVA